jgi:hypothetical protein
VDQGPDPERQKGKIKKKKMTKKFYNLIILTLMFHPKHFKLTSLDCICSHIRMAGNKLLKRTDPLAVCSISLVLITLWSRVLSEKLTRPKLLKKLPVFYGTQRIITVLTRAHHLSLSSARLIQSMPPIQPLKDPF